MYNRGNKCYVLAMLQVLWHVPGMLSALSDEHKKKRQPEKKSLMHTAYKDLLRLSAAVAERSSDPASPTKFIQSAAKAKVRPCQSSGQQDSQEFLVSLLHLCEQQTQSGAVERLLEAMCVTTIEGLVCTACAHRHEAGRVNATSLSLTLSKYDGNSVQALLNNYLAQEFVDVKCASRDCQRTVMAEKQNYPVDVLPRLLILHLRRHEAM